MNVTLRFQYNFNFFFPTLPSINTPTFLSHNFQCNFKFVFFLDSLVKVLCIMIISFDSLICVQLFKLGTLASVVLAGQHLCNSHFLLNQYSSSLVSKL